jgi:hypothetical protein
MARIGIFCFLIVASMGTAVAADMLVDDVPIPADALVTVPLDASEPHSRFSGAWVGSWGDRVHHILIVENISARGDARVVYAFGNNAAFGIVGQWRRHEATVSGNTLTIDDTFNATYVLTATDSLRATYRRGGVIVSATLSRVALAALMLPGAKVAWTAPREFLSTALQEGGKSIRLEVVIKKPSGSGPFPLLVFNHGSTGRGTDPNLFTETYASPAIADFFVERGWIVAFSPAPRQRQIGWPLRRGFRARPGTRLFLRSGSIVARR